MLTTKKKAKKNPYPLLDAEETAIKAEEKTEVLNAFFVSVFTSKTEYPLGNLPPELVDRDGASRKDPQQFRRAEKILSNPGGSSQWQGC